MPGFYRSRFSDWQKSADASYRRTAPGGHQRHCLRGGWGRGLCPAWDDPGMGWPAGK